MAINLNDNLLVQAPKATDERYGPYNSEAEALSAIEPIVRYQGLTAGVFVTGQLTDYWFRDGILDVDFVEKAGGGEGATGPSGPTGASGASASPGPTGPTGVDLSTRYNIEFVCSDETTDLTTGLKFTFRMPYTMELSGLRLNTNTPPVGSDLVLSIKKDGVSIFDPLSDPTIWSGDDVGGGSLAPYTILFEQSEITIQIDSVGSVQPGTGLKVWMSGSKPACTLPPYFCNINVDTS